MSIDEQPDVAAPPKGGGYFPPETIRRIREAAPELGEKLSRLLATSVTNSREQSQSIAARAVIIERVLLLASGSFVLSLNFTASVAAELHRENVSSQVGFFAHSSLYCAWVLLLVSIGACCLAWLLTHFESQLHEKLRQFNVAEVESRESKLLAHSLAIAFKGGVVNLGEHGDSPDVLVDLGKIMTMVDTIASRTDAKNAKSKLELSKTEMPTTLYLTLIGSALFCLPVALLLLLIFALRVASLMLR